MKKNIGKDGIEKIHNRIANSQFVGKLNKNRELRS